MNLNDLRMGLKAALDNMWARIDARIHAIEEGGGGGGQDNVIEAISFNGTNVPPDANKRVSLTETDPTVPAWAKAASKPTYTASEVGALPASTPIPSKTSDLTNDSGFLTAQTGVTGVKGDAEASYRQGNVNLTPANIGALSSGRFENDDANGLWYFVPDVDITQPDNGLDNIHTTEHGNILNAGDRQGHRFALVPYEIKNSGQISLGLWLINPGTPGASVKCYVNMGKDGTVSFLFSHPAEIKQALGIIEATQSAAGLMSATDKAKLDGIETGAQANTVTGVKGDAEASYRQGNVNLTPANIGALASTGVLTPSAAFSIPAAGSSISYNMAGMTASHILTHWNFSNSAENAPPANLTWTTYAGYFTIANNGGTTAETIRPVFELPTNVSITGI